jgi:dienelactone hydrolase
MIFRSCSVSDLPTLGRVTIDEAKALIEFIGRSEEFGPIVLTGNSMGGLHSAMTAALTPSHELGVVSWLGPPTADHVFCMVHSYLLHVPEFGHSSQCHDVLFCLAGRVVRVV